MNQTSALRWLLIFIVCFGVYFIISYKQIAEREARFQSIEQSINKIEQEIQQLREEIKQR